MYNEVKKGAEKQQTNLTKERNKRCIPAAMEILKIVAEGRIADEDKENLFKEYVPLSHRVMDVLMKHEVKLGEINYVFRLVMQPVSFLQEMVDQSMGKHVEKTEEMFWGKVLTDVTVKDLDAKLKEQNLPSLE